MTDVKSLITSVVSSVASESIRTRSNSNTCAVSGVCRLPSGNTVVVDYANKEIKLLDNTLTLINTYSTDPLTPFDVCHIVDDEVAVTVSDSDKEHRVQFLDTGDDVLKLTRNVSLDHAGEGIVSSNGKLYVSSSDAVYVYTTSGQPVREIFKEESMDLTDSRLAIGENGKRIYLTNPFNDQLITLDQEGNVLTALQDDEMKYPTGVCVASDGTVLVCGQNSDSVIQVDRHGSKKLATVAGDGDGMFQPSAVTFDTKTSRLIVGQFCDQLTVLELAGTEH